MYSVIVTEVVLVLGRVAGGGRAGLEVAAQSERNSSDFKPNGSLMKHNGLVSPAVCELLTEGGGDVWVSESVHRRLLFLPAREGGAAAQPQPFTRRSAHS